MFLFFQRRGRMPLNCDNIINEFKDINFKDKRLNKRFGSLMKNLVTSPAGLISKVFVNAKDQKAAYRFFENDKTTYQKMFQSHQQRVRERCEKQPVVLAIQDSSIFFLRGAQKASDMGLVGNLRYSDIGLNIHTSLLITPESELLGISDIHAYDRKPVGKKRSKTYDQLPALQKETGKWIRAITNTRKVIGENVRLVWIADREGDFWDYFSKLEESKEWFVQRVVHERAIKESEEDYFAYVKKSLPIGCVEFLIDSRGGENERAKRVVECEIRTAEITMKRPKRLPREVDELQVRVIHVIEKGEKKPSGNLEWYLITNVKCTTYDEIVEKIHWYRMRWMIEELHRVVKSGCGAEEMRLESKDRLMKYLLLLFVVGTRILWISKLAKVKGEEPCTEAFSDEEWQILYVRKYNQKPPDNYVPTIKEAVRLLGILGGFYEYNKREPGTMTLWRGMKRLKELIKGIEECQKIIKLGV